MAKRQPKQQPKVTLAEKKELVSMAKKNGITLDGHKAQLVGVLCKFPTVCTIANDGASFEYSWSDIRNVMKFGGGKFTS